LLSECFIQGIKQNQIFKISLFTNRKIKCNTINRYLEIAVVDVLQ